MRNIREGEFQQIVVFRIFVKNLYFLFAAGAIFQIDKNMEEMQERTLLETAQILSQNDKNLN